MRTRLPQIATTGSHRHYRPDGPPDAARGSDAIFHDDHIKAFMLAVESKLIRTAIQGLNSEAFGYVSNVYVYSTPEEAAEAARAAIADRMDTDPDEALTA